MNMVLPYRKSSLSLIGAKVSRFGELTEALCDTARGMTMRLERSRHTTLPVTVSSDVIRRDGVAREKLSAPNLLRSKTGFDSGVNLSYAHFTSQSKFTPFPQNKPRRILLGVNLRMQYFTSPPQHCVFYVTEGVKCGCVTCRKYCS